MQTKPRDIPDTFKESEVTRLGIDSGLQSTLASFSLAFIELTKYYSRLFVHAHCKKSENFLAGLRTKCLGFFAHPRCRITEVLMPSRVMSCSM